MKNRLTTFLVNNKEIALVLTIIMVLSMMIIPLPTGLMDMIIAFNIAISLLIMMVVVYMQSSISLTSFPTILLILALIRIGITVSTSRLILLEGDAGEIVSTFGEFVVGGNIIVGMIIFIIITIINFIVITKGSERVAEVAARFSLDAMPGKQMSIDSDLRAGNISNDEANKLRKVLGLESKLYGAMDGSMKFVKGDAIASIVDILINLLGGLAIGLLQRGMSFSDAITQYSILTIGDGLVQQIPALLISITAGMMITHVSDSGEGANLGNNILNQIFTQHKSIFAACLLILIMAVIPGMPSLVFLALFILLFLVALVVKRRHSRENSPSESKVFLEDSENTNSDKDELTNVNNFKIVPLMLSLPEDMRKTEQLKTVKQILTSVRQEIAYEVGVTIPQIIIRYHKSIPLEEFKLLVSEIPIVDGRFYWDRIVLLDTQPQTVAVLDMNQMIPNSYEFGEAKMGVWIDHKNITLCEQYEIPHLKFEQFLVLHFKSQIRRYMPDFLGIQEVKNILDQMTEYQELIKELLRMISLNKITEIFQRLVTENISIRNFKLIMDAMLEWSQKEKEPIILVEYVRQALGRYIAHKFSSGSYLIPVITISVDLEDMLRDSIRFANSGSYLALDPNIVDSINSQLINILNSTENINNLALVTQFDVRRYLRSAIEKKHPNIPVLSFQELDNLVEFNNIGTIEYFDSE